ncbi:hypothetical protein BC351_22115 [Paenibacillus ferrarius]|uniref:Uncharacterized protein n=1 Tax=Paenibacillus ferrarius TaxID=1469647 RepID=A0A1V4HN42_9BACL|nr:hypothetical protein [Paenibacillus ferrarius]OPH59026.1 hypothetical protein BC351_22115 [Paenibacillus ferrarius]
MSKNQNCMIISAASTDDFSNWMDEIVNVKQAQPSFALPWRVCYCDLAVFFSWEGLIIPAQCIRLAKQIFGTLLERCDPKHTAPFPRQAGQIAREIMARLQAAPAIAPAPADLSYPACGL